jgi:hypothetical protein
LQILFGLGLGLLLVEAGFWWRDEGAFPHLNVYAPDAELGARLRPGATQRFKLGDNPVSNVRINARGLRGAELPAQGKDEILVIGDSQVFGLGVEEHEAFAMRLAALTKRPVVNGGVPTYGPLEYNALAAELIAERKPKLVIYTVNMLNDVFEHSRPNTERHRVWDGWAVRSETAPHDVLAFPGRALLYRDSHAVYALRRYLHAREARPQQVLASEGLTTDLWSANAASIPSQAALSAQLVARTSEREQLEQAQAEAEEKSEQALRAAKLQLHKAPPPDDHPARRTLFEARYTLRQQSDMAAAHPGDILVEPGAEAARPVKATAQLIREAIRDRERALAVIDEAERAELEALKASRAHISELSKRKRELAALKLDRAQVSSVLEPRLREIRDVAERSGAEVIVVALPIDVQVSSAEWKKYGAPVTDMTPTLALTDDVIASARALGMRTLDALPALRAASPGAFLHGDIHMTAKGHAAVAEAITTAMKEPAPTRTPKLGLPAGRSYPFVTYNEWHNTERVFIERAAEVGCEVIAQDEWLGVSCEVSRRSRQLHLDARVLEGGHGEVVTYRSPARLQLRAPLFAGERFRARIEWQRGARELVIERAADGSWSGRFGPEQPSKPTRKPLALDPATFECEGSSGCAALTPELATCQQASDMQGGNHEEHLVLCTLGQRSHWAKCPEGQVNAFPAGHCMPLCNREAGQKPCASGTCESWQGVEVCKPL